MRYVRQSVRERIEVEMDEPETVTAAAVLVVTAWKMGDRGALEEALKRLEAALERRDADDGGG